MRTMVKKLLAKLPSLSVWLYEHFSTETFLVTWNYVPLAWPRRAGEGIDFHWLQHNPNDCVGFGVYPARILSGTSAGRSSAAAARKTRPAGQSSG